MDLGIKGFPVGIVQFSLMVLLYLDPLEILLRILNLKLLLTHLCKLFNVFKLVSVNYNLMCFSIDIETEDW